MKRRSKLGQVTMEFTLLIVFMMLLMSTLFVALEARMSITKDSKNLRTLQEVTNILTTEVNLAYKLGHGYTRYFYVPTTLNGHNYTLQILQNVDLVVKYDKLEYVTFLDIPVCYDPPCPPDSGTLQKGTMRIFNDQGDVFIAPVP